MGLRPSAAVRSTSCVVIEKFGYHEYVYRARITKELPLRPVGQLHQTASIPLYITQSAQAKVRGCVMLRARSAPVERPSEALMILLGRPHGVCLRRRALLQENHRLLNLKWRNLVFKPSAHYAGHAFLGKAVSVAGDPAFRSEQRIGDAASDDTRLSSIVPDSVHDSGSKGNTASSGTGLQAIWDAADPLIPERTKRACAAARWTRVFHRRCGAEEGSESYAAW